MRADEPLSDTRGISNLTICLLGALLGLAAGLFILRGFIFSPGLVEQGDLRWPYSSEVYPMHYLWDEPRQYFVVINHMLGRLVPYLFAPEAAERLFILAPFPIMGLSMFFATFKLTARRLDSPTVPLIAGTVATLFFIVNPTVAIELRHQVLLWFYAFLPLLVYVSYTAFSGISSHTRSKIVKNSIYIALLLFVMSISNWMLFFFPVLLLPFLAAFSRPYGDHLKKSILLIGLTFALFAVFCSVWLVPLALGSGSSSPSRVPTNEVLDALSGRSQMINVLTQTSFWETEFFHSIFTLQGRGLSLLWGGATLMMPILAFSSFLLRKDRLAIWLGIFALAFIFLAKGTQPPFGGLYHWLVFDSPVVSSFGWQYKVSNRWNLDVMFCYSLLIGFTASYVLGWIRASINWDRLRKGLFAAAILVFLAVPPVAAYPLLTGDLSGTMKPQELPSDYVALNQWLDEEGSDSKVMFYPEPPRWGAAKPTLALAYELRLRVFRYYWLFMDDSLLHEGTARYGELLAPWNVGHIVVRGDLLNEESEESTQEVLSALLKQEDLELVKQFGSLYVFENQAYSSHIGAASQSVVVSGGLENITSLTSLDSYDLADSPIVFLDQSEVNSDYLLGADILVSSQGNPDLHLSLLGDEYLLKPFDATHHHQPAQRWSKGSTEEFMYIHWHSYLRGELMENWQIDYGKGLVFTWAQDTLDIPFGVGDSGSYDLFVRYFRNQDGGTIRIWLDGEPLEEMETKDQVNQFVWEKVDSLKLDKGKHQLAMENLEGFNAVNLFALLPAGEIEEYELDVAISLLGDECLLKPFDATRHYSPAQRWSTVSTEEFLYVGQHPYLRGEEMENWQFDYGKGLVFTWAPDTLDVPFGVKESGSYDLFIRYFQNQNGGGIRIWLNGEPLKGMRTRYQVNGFVWEKVDSLKLDKGKHQLAIQNLLGFNAVNLFAVLPAGEVEEYEREVSDLLRDKRIIYVLEAESEFYYSEAQISQEFGAEASNGRVIELGNNSQVWQEIDILRDGNYRLAIGIKGSASVEIDNRSFPMNSTDLSLRYLDPIYLERGKHRIQISPIDTEGSSYLDVVWLYSVQEGSETLEDIFTPKERIAQVIEYEKINPTKYKVKIDASQPFMLSLSEAYDPLWVAKVDGKEYRSVPLYSVVNGFWIEQTGELEITLEYKLQRWFYYGAVISLTGLVSALGYLVWSWISERRRKAQTLH